MKSLGREYSWSKGSRSHLAHADNENEDKGYLVNITLNIIYIYTLCIPRIIFFI